MKKLDFYLALLEMVLYGLPHSQLKQSLFNMPNVSDFLDPVNSSLAPAFFNNSGVIANFDSSTSLTHIYFGSNEGIITSILPSVDGREITILNDTNAASSNIALFLQSGDTNAGDIKLSANGITNSGQRIILLRGDSIRLKYSQPIQRWLPISSYNISYLAPSGLGFDIFSTKTAKSTVALVTGTSYIFPITLDQYTPFRNYNFEVTTAGTAGATARLTILTDASDATNWRTGDILASGTTVAIDSVGVKTGALTTLGYAKPGRYWLQIQVSANVTLRSTTNYFPVVQSGAASASCYTVAETYATLLANRIISTTASINPPYILFR
jgi:hypothetical protein